ncbi:hypothetical protein ACEPAH_2094 [Sanghuangporus vaninii]
MVPEVVPLWINAQRELASDGHTFKVHNPLNKNGIVTSACATSQGYKAASEAAGNAFDAWERTHASQKRAMFLKTADLILSDKYKQKITKAFWDETAASNEVLGFCINVNVALDVASRIRASMVNINGTTIHAEIEIGAAGLGGDTGYGNFDIQHFSVE